LGQGDLWFSTRPSLAAPWSPPENFGSRINSPAYQGFAALASDGLSMIFNSNGAGGPWSGPLRISTRPSPKAEWSRPAHIWNDKLGAWSAFLSADHLSLLFDSKRSGGQGGFDLWMSHRVRKPSSAAADSAELQALRDLVDTKVRSRDAVTAQFNAGQVPHLDLIAVEVELIEARVRLAEAESSQADVVVHLQELVKLRTEGRQLVEMQVKAGIVTPLAFSAADAGLADAKARLAKAEAAAAGKKAPATNP
jgi:hypothetical protein